MRGHHHPGPIRRLRSGGHRPAGRYGQVLHGRNVFEGERLHAVTWFQ